MKNSTLLVIMLTIICVLMGGYIIFDKINQKPIKHTRVKVGEWLDIQTSALYKMGYKDGYYGKPKLPYYGTLDYHQGYLAGCKDRGHNGIRR